MPVTLDDFEVEFRGPTDSDRFNTALTQIQTDLLTANRLLQRENQRLTQYLQATNYINQALESRLTGVNASASAILSSWSGINAGKIIYADFRALTTRHSILTSYPNTSYLDVVHGQIRLPTMQSFSKIPLFRNQDGFLEPTSAVSVALSDDDTSYVTQDRTTSSAYDAIDRNASTFWIQEDLPISLNRYYKMTLPKAINPSINSLLIHPFPDGQLEIKEVAYLGLNSQWISIPSVNAVAATRTMSHFYTRDFNDQIRVQLGPSATFTDLGGANKKLFGLQNLDVGFIEYQPQAETVIQLEAGSSINAITQFSASYDLNTAEAGNYSSYDKNYIWFEIFTAAPSAGSATNRIYDSRVNVYPLTTASSPITFNGSTTVFVRVGMVGVSGTTPVLKNFTIIYR